MDQHAAPYVLAAGQARSHPGTSPVIKAGAADTGGLVTVAEEVVGPRTVGGPLHVHDQEDEFVYVIDGHLLVQLGEERHDLGPGCFAWMPRQVPHGFANVSDSPAHIVGGVMPGGIEKYFAAQSSYLAQLAGPPDLERIVAIWAGSGARLAGPPIEVDAAPAASRS